MRIIWTRHAEERQKQWEVKKGITREEVERVVSQPEQVVPGEHKGANHARALRSGG